MPGSRWRRRAAIALLSLVFLLVLLWIYGNRKTHESEAAYPPIGRFVSVDSVRLHYVLQGSGRPVVMIHGSDGLLQDFTLTIFDSVASFAQAIAFDRPGHGYSGRPDDWPLTLALNARLIYDAVEKLGIVQPIIVGHSYGGAVALQYALEYPNDIAGLVLLSPAVYADALPIGRTGATLVMSIPNAPIIGPILTHCLIAPLFGLGVEAGIKASFDPNPVTPAYAQIMKALMPRPSQFSAWADESAHFRNDLDSLEEHYGEMTAPAIIVLGQSDQIAPFDLEGGLLAQVLGDCELVQIPNTGHMVHHAAPGVVVANIRKMLHAVAGKK
ncbi:hypothetical protein C3F09_06730 [candidate division GN15 bacterium]|uniref:AB hydrolase-1 domain-containing protein n=1 Tax=candidate division GN15 bacterium TaxID=2072418 RepID=A0A855X7B9_9BACT|nr:MAG: hypothetical protein C3F09_06730 [candidate division GN15 bacterium]